MESFSELDTLRLWRFALENSRIVHLLKRPDFDQAMRQVTTPEIIAEFFKSPYSTDLIVYPILRRYFDDPDFKYLHARYIDNLELVVATKIYESRYSGITLVPDYSEPHFGPQLGSFMIKCFKILAGNETKPKPVRILELQSIYNSLKAAASNPVTWKGFGQNLLRGFLLACRTPIDRYRLMQYIDEGDIVGDFASFISSHEELPVAAMLKHIGITEDPLQLYRSILKPLEEKYALGLRSNATLEEVTQARELLKASEIPQLITKVQNTNRDLIERLNLAQPIVNQTNLNLESIYDYAPQDLVIVEHQKQHWAFTRDELPHLIMSGKNPWNQTKFNALTIEAMRFLLQIATNLNLPDCVPLCDFFEEFPRQSITKMSKAQTASNTSLSAPNPLNLHPTIYAMTIGTFFHGHDLIEHAVSEMQQLTENLGDDDSTSD